MDSVLQRDGRRDRGGGLKTKKKKRKMKTKRGQRMVRTDTETKRDIERVLKSKTEIGFAVENHQGVRSHREWEKFGLSFLSCSECLFTPDVCIKY